MLVKIRLENDKEIFYLEIDLFDWEVICKKYNNYLITIKKFIY